ncbi:tetratricopeptide repeat protein [Humidesulfovibrio idahonensis]
MRRKIEWYQEVLALEPGSRIFFPLAKLFVEFGQYEDAEKTLKQGLDRHPDSMEARLLLIQVLSRLERHDEAQAHLALVIKPLERYPAFWTLWAQQTAEKDRDFSVFLMLVASHFTEKPVKWTDVLIEGLHSITDRLLGPLKAAPKAPRAQAKPAAAVAAPSSVAPAAPSLEAQPTSLAERVRSVPQDISTPAGPAAGGASHLSDDSPDAPYEGPTPEPSSFRTRTMAELLASQGDFGGALGIYRELWGRTQEGPEKAELTGRIKTLEESLAAAPQAEAEPKAVMDEDPFGKHAKNRLMSTLEALAARLESRIQA